MLLALYSNRMVKLLTRNKNYVLLAPRLIGRTALGQR